MSFVSVVKEKALVACARHCTICHRFVGIKIECHHIKPKSEGGRDDFENCIPLCFDCHADMRTYDHKHPKGTKYTESELILHRDGWYKKIKQAPVAIYDDFSKIADSKTFNSFIEKFNYDYIKNLRDTNFGHPFHFSLFEKIDKFLDNQDNPESEFLDSDIESRRANCVSLIFSFAKLLSANTWRIDGNSDYTSVPREWQSTGQHERFDRVVSEVHELVVEIESAYLELHRTLRRKIPDWRMRAA